MLKNKVQIFQDIEPVGLGGFHQAVRAGSGSCAVIGLAEQPVLPANHKGTDRGSFWFRAYVIASFSFLWAGCSVSSQA
jgi:hypothetical protein